eukprot:TRINITY_DN32872_c0_g1_i1.p1 TRINITY_DN32872_c0_g1~~TRINITY_DN32872_c0_g1_i1.p1  ORF type:complete len:542 (+),score=176.26 TRINITY_DN32872_c0_g1_i1:85-1626(+)
MRRLCRRALRRCSERGGRGASGAPVPGELPREGGPPAERQPRPGSRAARIREKVELQGSDLLRKLPSLQKHLTGKEKVYVNRAAPQPEFVRLAPERARVDDPELRRAEKLMRRDEELAVAEDELEGPTTADSKSEQVTVALGAFMARASLLSRHERQAYADGLVRVNGVTMRNHLHRVSPTDEVKYRGRRVLIDYPRLWRYRKPLDDQTLMLNRFTGQAFNRDKLKGVPDHVQVVKPLSIHCGGIILLTNDAALRQYLECSPDIEQEYLAVVQGAVPPNLLRRLNTATDWFGQKYSKMEWAVTAIRQGTVPKREAMELVTNTTLHVRVWHPAPPLGMLLKSCGKLPIRMWRIKYGPYLYDDLKPKQTREAFIDEQLMQFTDHRWIPFIEAAAPQHREKSMRHLQKQALSRRVVPRPYAELLEKELDTIREDTAERLRNRRAAADEAARRRGEPVTEIRPAGVSPDSALERSTRDELSALQRRKRVASGVPLVSWAPAEDLRAQMKKPDIVRGL